LDSVGIAPNDRGTWLLENSLVIVFVALVAIFHRVLLLSRISYTLIFLFLCGHEIGAHFTYAEVPYDEWCQTLFGGRLNDLIGWERNNFDRIVHFSTACCSPTRSAKSFCASPMHAGSGVTSFPRPHHVYFYVFELVEWAVAVVFGSGSSAYLGRKVIRGDSHKDMALASLGALIAMTINAFVNWRLQRDSAREGGESLRVKQRAPLGEDEAERMIRQEKNNHTTSARQGERVSH
jgi:putative membrane protein